MGSINTVYVTYVFETILHIEILYSFGIDINLRKIQVYYFKAHHPELSYCSEPYIVESQLEELKQRRDVEMCDLTE
jgi:hypothetical protein